MARRFNIEVEVSSKGIRKLEKQLEGVKREAGQTSRGMRQMQSQLRLLARTAAVAGVAMAGIFVKNALQKAAAQERAFKGVEQAIKATGGAAGLTATEVAEMAARLQDVSVFGDETILTMQNILLTFKNIRGEAFEKTSQAVLDMATVMGTDLKSAALQLGKALNDPVKRMAELSRAGVTFSQAQIDAVKAMGEANDIAGAQAIILEELESQFGGAAAAARNTFSGAVEALGNTIGDLMEVFGEGLTPALTEATLGLQAFLDTAAVSQGVQILANAVSALAGAFTALGKSGEGSVTELLQLLIFVSEAGGLGSIGGLAASFAKLGLKEELNASAEEMERIRLAMEEAKTAAGELAKQTAETADESARLSKSLEAVRVALAESEAFVAGASEGLEAIRQKYRDIEDGIKAINDDAREHSDELSTIKGGWEEIEAAVEDVSGAQNELNRLTEEYEESVEEAGEEWQRAGDIIQGAMLSAFAAIARGADETASLITAAFVGAGALIGAHFGNAGLGAQIGGIVGSLFGGTSSAEKRQKRRRREAEALARAEEEAALRARALAIKIGELAFEMREGVKEAIEFSRQLRAIGEDPGIAFQELAANLQAMRNGILGINETAEERIRRQAEEFNRELALIKAENTAKLAELQITLAILQAEQGAVNAHLQASKAYVMGITGVASATAVSADLIAGAMASIEASIGEIENLLAALPAAISEEEITKAIKRTRRSTKGFASSIGKIGPTMEEAKQSIEEFLESLKGGSSISALPPLTQIQNLQKQFVGLVNQALGGNVQAANQLPQIAQQLLSLAQQFSPALFVQLSQFVQAMLMKVLGKGGEVQSFQGGGVVEGSGAQMALLHPPEAVVPLKGGSVPVEFKTPSVVPQTRILREIKSELVRHRHERRSDRLHRRATDRRILAQPPALPVDGVHVTRPPL
jgi:methyl-accepting chemotaxis protein